RRGSWLLLASLDDGRHERERRRRRRLGGRHTLRKVGPGLEADRALLEDGRLVHRRGGGGRPLVRGGGGPPREERGGGGAGGVVGRSWTAPGWFSSCATSWNDDSGTWSGSSPRTGASRRNFSGVSGGGSSRGVTMSVPAGGVTAACTSAEAGVCSRPAGRRGP